MINKIIAGLIGGLLMTGAIGLFANAKDNDIEYYNLSISQRGALCPDCNDGNMVLRPISYGVWYYYDDIECTHHKNGFDEIQRRSKLITWECTDCSAYFTDVGYDTRTVCHGY